MSSNGQRSSQLAGREQIVPHRTVLCFCKPLTGRRELSSGCRGHWEICKLSDQVLTAELGSGLGRFSFLFTFKPSAVGFGLPGEIWQLRLDSNEAEWLGPGSPTPGLVRSNSLSAITLEPWSCLVLEYVAEG